MSCCCCCDVSLFHNTLLRYYRRICRWRSLFFCNSVCAVCVLSFVSWRSTFNIKLTHPNNGLTYTWLILLALCFPSLSFRLVLYSTLKPIISIVLLSTFNAKSIIPHKKQNLINFPFDLVGGFHPAKIETNEIQFMVVLNKFNAFWLMLWFR